MFNIIYNLIDFLDDRKAKKDEQYIADKIKEAKSEYCGLHKCFYYKGYDCPECWSKKLLAVYEKNNQ